MKAKLSIDLSDFGISKTVLVETQQDAVKGQEIDTSSFGVPIAVALMIQTAICHTCGGEHHEHQGSMLELQYPTYRAFRQMELWERALYKDLPRRLEYRPVIDLEFCHDCFAVHPQIEAIMKIIHPAPAGTKFQVALPIVEMAYVEVEAYTNEEAIKKAIKKALEVDYDNIGAEEITSVREAVTGNTCNGPASAEAEEQEEEGADEDGDDR